MHLTFAQAYEIVCPDGGPVAPNSKEYIDIMELMRQSGYVPFQDKLIIENVPRAPTTVSDVKRYNEQPHVEPASLKISKKQWMSVTANKELFLKALNKK
jgi:hypothetical protein